MSTTFTHPEMRDGELFFTNSDSVAFKRLSWRSKRKGDVAYDGVGKPLHYGDWFPVFIAKDEVDGRALSLKRVRQAFRENHRRGR